MIMPGPAAAGSGRARPPAPAAAGRKDWKSATGSRGSRSLTSPITPSTRATVSGGMRRLNSATANVHIARIVAHISSDPSCPPQAAAITVMQRQVEVGIRRHVGDRKVIDCKRLHQAGKGQAQESELPCRSRPRQRHPAVASGRRPPAATCPAAAPCTAPASRKNYRVPRSFLFTTLLNGICGLGRHVILVVLRQHLLGAEHAVGPSLPWVTTPLPSRNRSGRIPR